MDKLSGQRGYLLLVIPILIVGILLVSVRAMQRAKLSMRLAGNDLNFLQTNFCVQKCASLAVNAATRALENNNTVGASSGSCLCRDENSGKALDCRSSQSAPAQKDLVNCYDLQTVRSDVAIQAECQDSSRHSMQLKEGVSFEEIPIFQFAVFFEKVLEIHNGPAMHVRGRVHSNDTVRIFPEELWLHDWVTSPVSVDIRTSAVGNVGEIGFPLADGSGPDPTVVNASPKVFTPLHRFSGIPDWSAWQKDHRVAYGDQSGACGMVQRLKLPLKQATNPHTLIEWRGFADDDLLKSQKYAHRGDLIYHSTWLNQGLTPAGLAPNPIRFPSPADPRLVQEPGKTRVRFWVQRENIFVKLLPVDMKLLQQRPGDSLVYLFDEFPDPSQGGRDAGGIFLYNAATLTRPITVVSNSRLYVWGNYNTARNYDLDTGGKGFYPAALVSDNFTLLSTDWDGRNFQAAETCCPGGRFIGTVVTLNACIMTGMQEVKGSWTGQWGYQNIIRHMEDWNGARLVFTGSVAALWSSLVAPPYLGDDKPVYVPPKRDWSFDPMYRKRVNMPPGTLRVLNPVLNDWQMVRGR